MDLREIIIKFKETDKNAFIQHMTNVSRDSNVDVKKQLSEIFGVFIDTESQEGSNAGIFVDIHNDLVKFLILKGVGVHEIPCLIGLHIEILYECKGKPLSEAVTAANQKIKDSSHDPHFTGKGLSVFATHLFANFFRHFHLYQHCIFSARERLDFQTLLDVETPEMAEFTLSEAKSEGVWDYLEKIKALEKDERHQQDEIRDKHDGLLAHAQRRKQEMAQRMAEIPQPLTKEAVSDLVRAAVADSVAESRVAVERLIDDSANEVTFMIAKTCLPRPQALGPPPRFKPKSAVKVQKRPSAKKSAPQSGSRASRASGRKSKQ